MARRASCCSAPRRSGLLLVRRSGLLLLLTFVSTLVSAPTPDKARCAACSWVVGQLSSVLSSEKAELEKSKEANDKKAQKIDKVQKAQTKRWLKNEYGVALRSVVEEEMEVMCGRDRMVSKVDLKAACTALAEEHEEELPRAILDEKHAEFCAKAVPGCEGEAKAEAVAAFNTTMKSEPEPKGKAARKVRGVVTRIVGRTFFRETRVENTHVVVLLHNGSMILKGKGKMYEVADARYTTLVEEFYELAKLANGTARLRFAQLDLNLNDVPANTPLADPTGVALVAYLIGDRDEPKALPAVGEPSLAGATPNLVRPLWQQLLMYLPKRDGAALGTVLKKREEAEQPKPSKDSSKAAAEGAAAKPARRAAASKPKEDDSRRRSEQCDVCALIVAKLRGALNATKAELELSKEANDKKAQKIDKVQKAQTKRWLKNEYKVALAASVEETLESVCDAAAFLDPVCRVTPPSANESDSPTAAEPEGAAARFAWTIGDGPKDVGLGRARGMCDDRGKLHCRSVVEEYAEPLMRAVLDGRGTAECAKLLPRCDAPRIEALGAHAEALAPAAAATSDHGEDGSSDAASPPAATAKDEM